MQRLLALAGLAARRADQRVAGVPLDAGAGRPRTSRWPCSRRQIERALRAWRRVDGARPRPASAARACSTRARSRPSCSARPCCTRAPSSEPGRAARGGARARRAAARRAARAWPSGRATRPVRSAACSTAARSRARRTARGRRSARTAHAAQPRRPTRRRRSDCRPRSCSGCCASRARHALLLAVDDVDRIDEPSVGAAGRARASRRAASACSLARDGRSRGAARGRRARGAREPLHGGRAAARSTASRPRRCSCSVFGDVPNLALLGRAHPRRRRRPSARVHGARAAPGRARRDRVRRRQLDAAGRARRRGPAAARQKACSRRGSPRCQPRALRLARRSACSVFEAFERSDYVRARPAGARPSRSTRRSPSWSLRDVLQRRRASTRSRTAPCARALQAASPSQSARLHHRALAELYERTGRPPIAAAHALARRRRARARRSNALELMTSSLRIDRAAAELADARACRSSEVAVRARARARRRRGAAARPPRELSSCAAGWCGLVDSRATTGCTRRAAPALLAQLERDSGLAFYREQSAQEQPIRCSG